MKSRKEVNHTDPSPSVMIPSIGTGSSQSNWFFIFFVIDEGVRQTTVRPWEIFLAYLIFESKAGVYPSVTS